jgi:hypothetical protein
VEFAGKSAANTSIGSSDQCCFWTCHFDRKVSSESQLCILFFCAFDFDPVAAGVARAVLEFGSHGSENVAVIRRKKTSLIPLQLLSGDQRCFPKLRFIDLGGGAVDHVGAL